MFISSISIAMIIILSTIIMFISILISKKTNLDQEKLSPFECGFNPAISSRVPFSLRFFLIAMIFLIFDVEIVILLPIPISNLNFDLIYMSSAIIVLILILGLFHEWNKGALNWSH